MARSPGRSPSAPRTRSRSAPNLGLKQKRPGHRKPILETVTGDDLFRKTNTWHTIDRVIDRLNDRYYELITDPTTGGVVRHCEEPLSHHVGRGTERLQAHDFPRDDVALAAYFIWEHDGRPDGRDLAHWAMVIEQLRRARRGVP